MSKFKKIFGITILASAIIVIFYIGFNVEADEPYKIELIEIDQTSYLPTDEYFKYANLQEKDTYETLSLPLLKIRFEKHPYVKRADILYEGNGKIKVTLIEKKLWSLVLNNGNNFVLSSEYELLPILPFTQNLALPIINNPVEKNLRLFDVVKTDKNFIEAFKILDAAKIINPNLFDKISEIDLHFGSEIEIYFMFSDFPLKLGNSSVVKKIYIFNKLWNYIELKATSGIIEYIDLRYDEKVFLGLKEEILKDSQS